MREPTSNSVLYDLRSRAIVLLLDFFFVDGILSRASEVLEAGVADVPVTNERILDLIIEAGCEGCDVKLELEPTSDCQIGLDN